MTAPAPAPLAVSLGDPAGVGPELIAAAWAAREAEGLPPFFAVGGADLLVQAARSRGIDLPVIVIASPEEVADAFAQGLPVLGSEDTRYAPGQPDRAGAASALPPLPRASALAASGAAAALVTGPIAKARLAEVGFSHPGQTEAVAAACGIAASEAVMMLAGPSLRVVPLTVH
ncbi:MAG TPA: 4-hydroxythreonine-4-phosphate dehydrogenase PdxA, partial [Novosphingobium sp.]|nr:4-hydroxythreonine-4-phosphate dehydrogenase PdxA [Novosphingobium sp.]